jgi:hypothetical protein
MKNLRPPQFLESLYRDMRDRRLLLPAIALVVAVLAVPVLLKSGSTPGTPPAAPDHSSARSASAAVPAVVSQQIGVTKYQKRLARLQSKNPFHQQYTATPESGSLAPASGGTGSSTSDTSTGAGTTSTSTSSTPLASGGGSTSVSSSPPSSTSSNPSGTVHVPKSRLLAYTWRVSVKVGEPDHLKARPEVQRLAMLPSKGRPAATFIGATVNGDHALFLVSSDVDVVKGDGRCYPSPSSCQYVVMKPGDKANFHWAPNGKRYNLVLVDTHAVVVRENILKKRSEDAQAQQKLPLLGPG